MAFVDSLVAHLLRCQVDLWEIQARLQAETDCEALHDLRIQLRRLRSLLRPLRQHSGIAPLYAAAAELATRGITTAEGALGHPDIWDRRGAALMPETRSALAKIGDYLER